MRRLQVVVATAVAALLITALGPPVATAQSYGQIAVVNGIPGTKIDVCINGKEVRSRLPYGGKVFRILHNGRYVLKVFAKDPRKCRGAKLGQRSVTLLGNDYTIVFTSKAPNKVIVFDNTLGSILMAADVKAVAFRHAADLGNATFRYILVSRYPEVPLFPSSTAADPVWQKGDEFMNSAAHSPLPLTMAWEVRVTRPNRFWTIAGPKSLTVRPNYRLEWILVGTRPKNAKIVTFARPLL